MSGQEQRETPFFGATPRYTYGSKHVTIKDYIPIGDTLARAVFYPNPVGEELYANTDLGYIEVYSGATGTWEPDAQIVRGSLRVTSPAPLEYRYSTAIDANTVYTSPSVDLGAAATRVHSLAAFVLYSYVLSSGSVVELQGSDDNVNFFTLPIGFSSEAGTSTFAVARASPPGVGSPTPLGMTAAVMARYLRIKYTNGATPQTNAEMALTFMGRS